MFAELNHVTQALLATLFTWVVTAAGGGRGLLLPRRSTSRSAGRHAGLRRRRDDRRQLLVAAGPGHRDGRGGGLPAWVPAAGRASSAAALFLWGVDKLLPHLHPGAVDGAGRRASTRTGSAACCWCWPSRCTTSPRGWPSAWPSARVAAGLPAATLGGAVALAIGIGMQNFPEGMAVSMPLRREGLSRCAGLPVRPGLRHGGADRRRARRAWPCSPCGRSCPTPWPSPPAP